ncbi:MAG: hypothetical protein WD431_08390 [Cyclobacteriaceae bacterium]
MPLQNILLLLLALACGPGEKTVTLTSNHFVFENANIIDVKDGNIQTGHVIVETMGFSDIILRTWQMPPKSMNWSI